MIILMGYNIIFHGFTNVINEEDTHNLTLDQDIFFGNQGT